MGNYEFVAVFDGARSDEEIRPAIERVREILLTQKCEITYVEEWGRRKLAYPIQKKTEGYYVIYYFRVLDADSPNRELERYARITDLLIRYLLCRVPRLKTEEDAQREAAQRAPEQPRRPEPAPEEAPGGEKGGAEGESATPIDESASAVAAGDAGVEEASSPQASDAAAVAGEARESVGEPEAAPEAGS